MAIRTHTGQAIPGSDKTTSSRFLSRDNEEQSASTMPTMPATNEHASAPLKNTTNAFDQSLAPRAPRVMKTKAQHTSEAPPNPKADRPRASIFASVRVSRPGGDHHSVITVESARSSRILLRLLVRPVRPRGPHRCGVLPHLAAPPPIDGERPRHVGMPHLPGKRRDRDARLQAMPRVGLAKVVRRAWFEAGEHERWVPDLAAELVERHRTPVDVENAPSRPKLCRARQPRWSRSRNRGSESHRMRSAESMPAKARLA